MNAPRTIYELSEQERATMLKLKEAGLTVSIGEHAALRAENDWLRAHLEDIAHPTLIQSIDSLKRIARAALKGE